MADARLLVAPLPGGNHELGTAVESELRVDECKVRLDGAPGDEQLLGDLAVRQPVRDEIEDPPFLAVPAQPRDWNPGVRVKTTPSRIAGCRHVL
jgi:hypothetical protein